MTRSIAATLYAAVFLFYVAWLVMATDCADVASIHIGNMLVAGCY